jgi:hypothetical protein
MAYTLYPEQGGIICTLQNPTILNAAGGVIGVCPPHAHLWTAGPWALLATGTPTVLVTATTYFQYIGTIYKATTALNVNYFLSTTALTITYAEIALFKGTPGIGAAPASLTRLGFADCSGAGQFAHAPGLLTAPLNLSVSTQPGDDLWIAFASSASTPAQFKALQIDYLGTGFFASVAGRPSTITSPCTTAAINSTVSGVWCNVFF